MKITFFTETFLPKVDGIVTRLTKTIQHLIQDKNEVLLFCPEGSPSNYMGAKVIGVPLVASYHTHLPKYLEHYGMGMLEPLLWEMLKAAHNQADLNLCTSTAMVNELSEKGIQHTALWQRGVDTEIFKPELKNAIMRRRLLGEHSDEGSLLIYVGRLSAEKQIERIKPVLEALPHSRLALVGDGPYRQQLEKIFENTATTFVGYLSGEELASAYASGDAFLFPSSTETLGLVLLEAMAAGCPVVGANRGGIPDIITDGKNGCLFEPDGEDQGAKSLIEATQKLLGNDLERLNMRKAAREEAERWGWASATKQLQGFYENVLEKSKQDVA